MAAESAEPIERWTAKRWVALVICILNGETSVAEADRSSRAIGYHSAADDAAAAAIVRNCLHRRATAPQRIGVPHQIRELCDQKEWAGVRR